MRCDRPDTDCNGYFALVILLAVTCRVQSLADRERINGLVRKWAPLIWLAPEENYFPSSIEEFLEHVTPISKTRRAVRITDLTSKRKLLEETFLYPNFTGDPQKDSFIYGKDPSKNPVPVYAIVSHCKSDKNQNAIEDDNLHFHVTYWTFYPYNRGKDVCVVQSIPVPTIFNTCLGNKVVYGNHVGDFEHISLYFEGKPYPHFIYVSTHNSGAYYKFDAKNKTFYYQSQETRSGKLQKPIFPQTVQTVDQRPILFSAKGSHGLWSQPGIHYFVRIAGLTDSVGYGLPWKTWLNVKIYHLGLSEIPLWMKYDGKWGTAKYNCWSALNFEMCEYNDGPNGILMKKPHFHCTHDL